MNKKIARKRRAKHLRFKLKELKAIRLVLHRTPRHIYAQIIDPNNSFVLATASTTEKTISNKLLSGTGNITAASYIGQKIAFRAIKNNIKKVSCDRSGFKYHGRIKALVNSARKHGLQI